jgi:ATP-dependent protease ClpP protease subunit
MPNCSLLSHRFATMTMGSHADLIAARRQQDLLHRRILDHYRVCTNLHTEQDVEAELLQSTDRWLSPEEAVRFGIADRVWSPDAQEAA